MAPKVKKEIEAGDEAHSATVKIEAESGEVKKEMKEEMLEQALEEIKRELPDPGEENGKKEKKDKKGKKDKRKDGESKKRKAEDVETQEGEEGKLDTDTEYDAVDLTKCPQSLVIKGSIGHKNIEGSYALMDEASRGRPCYKFRGQKKNAYLYVTRKGKWAIGYDLGSPKSVAWCEASKLVVAPCEPYPYVWQVIDKKTKEEHGATKYLPQMSIRVLDSASEDVTNCEEALGFEPSQSDGLLARRSHGVRGKKRKIISPVIKTEAEAAGGAVTTVKAEASSVKAESDDDELGPEDDELGPEEQDSESGSDSDSDSDSGKSSSSNASASASQPAAAAPKAKAPAPVPAGGQDVAMLEKRRIFCGKIESQLDKLTIPQRTSKLAQLRLMLTGEKFEQTLKASGMDKQALTLFLEKLDRDHAKLVAKAPVTAAAATPKWLQEQKAKERRQQEGAGGVPQPVTPTEEEQAQERSHREGFTPMHKERNAMRTALKPKWKPRPQSLERRLSWHSTEKREVPIRSYRSCGDSLWYVMPGAVVSCDTCHKAVPQSMGSLQGAPGHSQFAQSMFLCTDCMGYGGGPGQ